MKIFSQLSRPLETQTNAGYNSKMGWKKPIQNDQGQVAVLFAMVFTFMFVLFAFVVDFGHLVQNKMNLQIAADSAAYAGAAWQARALNQMGLVNYRMKQNYKELVMRAQVTHARHNKNFPRNQSDLDGPIEKLPAGFNAPSLCLQAHGFETVRGRRYAKDTNLCYNADPTGGGLPPIVVPPVLATFDPFSIAIANQIKEIQRQADIECEQGRDDNERMVQHLLDIFAKPGTYLGGFRYRGDRARFHESQMKAIENFINESARENPMSSSHPVLAAARESALRNLTDSNLNGDFKIEVLAPRESTYIKMKEIVAANAMYYFDFQSRGSACVAMVGRRFFEALVGYEKDPQYLTYFGVKLTSKPKMLFMPQTWVDAGFPTLEAYAVAKPFGSRIGPKATADALIPVPRSDGQSRILDFGVRPFDRVGGGRSAKLMAYYDSLHPRNDIGRPQGNRAVGWPEPDKNDQLRAPLQAIRTPTIFDALFYTVFPDPGTNMNQDYEEPNFALALYPDAVDVAGPTNEPIATRTPATGLPYRIRPSGPRVSGAHYDVYATEQPGSHSTTGPLALPGIDSPAKAREFGFATKEIYHSAWAPVGEAEDNQGRIGYGVKFISTDTLMKRMGNLSSSGNQIDIRNLPSGEPNLFKILH
ncbi:MAG: TadE/TadG family type IV pilus assembly protein [Pseudomonadota bacterium]